jgi:hypothetical protein
MSLGNSPKLTPRVIEALHTDQPLANALVATGGAVHRRNLEPESETALADSSATLPDNPTTTVGRIERVQRYRTEETCTAVAGTVTVNGEQFDTLLSDGTFGLSRADQIEYARKLGYRIASREENQAYVEGLLAKEAASTIDKAEKNALDTYRDRYVRDWQSGLIVIGRCVKASCRSWCAYVLPDDGALFVRPSS